MNKCGICKSGHAGSEYDGSYFKFPKEENSPALRENLIEAVPFADCSPPKSTRLFVRVTFQFRRFREGIIQTLRTHEGGGGQRYLLRGVTENMEGEEGLYLSRYVTAKTTFWLHLRGLS